MQSFLNAKDRLLDGSRSLPNLWIATFNDGKLKEFKSLFRDTDFEIKSPREFEFYKSPEETGDTFLENATIKAKSFRPLVPENDWVLSEDSGLEVTALNNLPGVHSARYAGPKALDRQNNDKLLKMLAFKKTADRSARYFCQMVALGPGGIKLEVSGECKGKIANIPSNAKGGFGYDPLFIPEGFDKTMAELTPREKNKISHRGKAARELLSKLT